MDSIILESVLASAKQQWDRGDRPDAEQIMAAHPLIKDKKSIVLELAYEEYCRRSISGECIDTNEFCDRFPVCKLSLRRRIEVHEFLHENIDDWIDGQAWPEEGDSFGEFSLGRQLGRGVDSRVFLARQRSLSNRLVVLKLTQHGYREARLLSTLEHANIVPIHSVEEDAATGLVAICMPYLTPWTLMDFLDAAHADGPPPSRFADAMNKLTSDAPVDPPTAEEDPMTEFLARCSFVDGVLHLMSQVVQALRHTHERGILHLDLKPSNILITRSGIPLVLDFNLAVDAKLNTAYGGTLPYMSPEQLRICFSQEQHQLAVTASSDVYSAGVVTHQLLVGTLPFGVPEEGTPPEIASALMREQAKGAPGLRASCRHLDARTSRFLERCLSYDADLRPSCMAECAKLFRQSLALGPRIRRWSNAHRMLVIILLLIGITGVGGGAYAIATRDLRDVAYHRRGLDCLAEGQSELATTHFTRAIELNPDADVYWYSRGRARQAMGDINGAIDDYQASLSRRQRPEYYARMGHCYAIQKNFVLAIEFFEEAIGRGLRTSDIYNCVGRCCLMKNDNEAAISAFQSALAADERSWQAHYGLALAEMRSAKSRRVDVPDEAKSWIRRAMELGPENWRLPFMAATIYYECSRGSGRNADLAEAIRYLKKCTVLRIPRSTLASFASLPDLNRDEGFVLLLHDYQPVDPQSTPLNLLPDPVPSTE